MTSTEKFASPQSRLRIKSGADQGPTNKKVCAARGVCMCQGLVLRRGERRERAINQSVTKNGGGGGGGAAWDKALNLILVSTI